MYNILFMGEKNNTNKNLHSIKRQYEGLGSVLILIIRLIKKINPESQFDFIGRTPNSSDIQCYLRGKIPLKVKLSKKKTIFPLFYDQSNESDENSSSLVKQIQEKKILCVPLQQNQIIRLLSEQKIALRQVFWEKFIQFESQLKTKFIKNHRKTKIQDVEKLFIFIKTFLSGRMLSYLNKTAKYSKKNKHKSSSERLFLKRILEKEEEHQANQNLLRNVQQVFLVNTQTKDSLTIPLPRNEVSGVFGTFQEC